MHGKTSRPMRTICWMTKAKEGKAMLRVLEMKEAWTKYMAKLKLPGDDAEGAMKRSEDGEGKSGGEDEDDRREQLRGDIEHENDCRGGGDGRFPGKGGGSRGGGGGGGGGDVSGRGGRGSGGRGGRGWERLRDTGCINL